MGEWSQYWADDLKGLRYQEGTVLQNLGTELTDSPGSSLRLHGLGTVPLLSLPVVDPVVEEHSETSRVVSERLT